MADNARFHNKLHRKNHHTNSTPGYPDAATDPIASHEEPFQGDFVLNAALSAQTINVNTSAYFGGDTTIHGNLSVFGPFNYFQNFVTVTSAVSVINAGTGPALSVVQYGAQPIVRFIDGDGPNPANPGGGKDAFFIENNGQVVINGNTPVAGRVLSIYGNVSASGNTEFQGGSANGLRSFAANSSVAYGVDSAVFGTNNKASGATSFAVGSGNNVTGPGAFAAGTFNTVNGYGSFSEGSNNYINTVLAHAEGTSNTITGQYSHVEGVSNTVTSSAAHAEGSNNTINGNYSHTEGSNNYVTGNNAHAEGSLTVNRADYAHTEGFAVSAFGTGSHAEGQGTTSTGSYSHAEGNATVALGNYSHAEGNQTVASGQSNHTQGHQTSAFNFNSHAEGSYTFASGRHSHAQGTLTQSLCSASHAGGVSTVANGPAAQAWGISTYASGSASYTNGYLTSSFGSYNTVLGVSNVANNSGGFVAGYGSVVNGAYAAALGVGVSALGDQSFAQGISTSAPGSGAVALGWMTYASGFGSFAQGVSSLAIGYGAFASGETCIAKGYGARATGDSNVATGIFSRAEGTNSLAQGVYSHAEGGSTQALGDYSHTDGVFTVTTVGASGAYAGGINATASGPASWTMGSSTTAAGFFSFAQGCTTVAAKSASIAIGNNAASLHDYSYIWAGAPTSTQTVSTTRVGQYLLSAAGGVALYGGVGINTDDYATNQLTVAGDVSASGNVTVMGNLSVYGALTYLDTVVSVTSSLSVVNAGTGPAIYVEQYGAQSVARFVENSGGVPVDALFIENNGYIGMNTNTPIERLTIAGAITALNGLTASNALFYNDVSATRVKAFYTDSNQVTANDIYGFSNETVFTDGSNLAGSGPTTLTLNYPGGVYNSSFEVVPVLSATSISAVSAAYFGTIKTGSVVSSGDIAPLTVVGSTSGSVFGRITNTTPSVSSSADLSIYNDAGNYLDIGVNSSIYNGAVYGLYNFNVVGPNDGYVYNTAANMAIGASNGTSDVFVFAGGTQTTNEVARFKASGNVGIGITTPNAKLTVAGTISASNTLSANGGYHAGNVGIKINNPAETLTVFGTISSSGGLSANNGYHAGAVGIGTNAPGVSLYSGATNTVKLDINNNAVLPLSATSGTTVHITQADSAVNRILVDSFGLGANARPSFTGRHANGTGAAPTAVQAGDVLCEFTGQGFGGTKYSNSSRGRMTIKAAEVWTDAANGTYLGFEATSIGGSTPSEVVRIDSTGLSAGGGYYSSNVGININTPAERLTVAGNISASGGLSANNGYHAGNVGIKVNAPAVELTVNGSISANGNITSTVLTQNMISVALIFG